MAEARDHDVDRIELDDDTYDAWLRTLWAEDVKRFDRTVLSLAGGALGLSVTFVGGVAADPAIQLGLLGVGWLFLVLAVFLVVASYIPSKSAIECRMEGDDENGDKMSARAWGLSLAGGGAFGIGIVFLGWFALVNVT